MGIIPDGNNAWVTTIGDTAQGIYLGGGTRFVDKSWSVDLENLVSASDPALLSVYIERDSAKRVIVQNSGNALTVISLTGVLSGKLQAFKLDTKGDPASQGEPIESRDGYIRLFLNPRASYALIASP
jgi:hypothetical protein